MIGTGELVPVTPPGHEATLCIVKEKSVGPHEPDGAGSPAYMWLLAVPFLSPIVLERARCLRARQLVR